jgi:hypothetical protein
MTGPEALQAILEMKNVRRKSWSKQEYVEVKNLNDGTFSLQRHMSSSEQFVSSGTRSDVFAKLFIDLLEHNDWEIAE